MATLTIASGDSQSAAVEALPLTGAQLPLHVSLYRLTTPDALDAGSAALVFEGSDDNSNWYAIRHPRTGLRVQVILQTAAIAGTVGDGYLIAAGELQGWRYLRAEVVDGAGAGVAQTADRAFGLERVSLAG